MTLLLPDFVSNPNTDIYLSNNYLVLDFETTNHEKGSALCDRNSLLLACWVYGNSERRNACFAAEWHQQDLVSDIYKADFIVCHNTKFELGWLKRCGVDLRKVLPFCTMIGEKVIAGNRKAPLSLDATAARYGLGQKVSSVNLLIKAGVCPSQMSPKELRDYCFKDVELTANVFKLQRQTLKEKGLLPVAYCRNLVTPALADIEFNGMTLDALGVSATYDEYAAKYKDLSIEFAKVTNGINVKSGKQMAEFIYGTLKFEELTDYRGKLLKTPAGAPKTDKETLGNLKATTPEQKAFLKVAKELIKLKTPMQNLIKMSDICKENPSDPRVFAVFNQTATVTDRLSSSGRGVAGFNFQNFDRSFKKLFKAKQAGWLLCEGDAPQLEFRVAALLGNDPVAKNDINLGVDIHANTASVLGCSRQNAKAKTFRPLYGGNNGTPKEKAYFEYFRTRYEGIFNTQTAWTMSVARHKTLVMPWGLRAYWPDTEIRKSGYITNTTQIFNLPIQSLATADIIPLTLVLLWHKSAALDGQCTLVNTVHDSIVAEVAPEVIDAYKAILVDCFAHDIYGLLHNIYPKLGTIDVPLGVGIKAATHWGEGVEEKHEPNIYSDCLVDTKP